MANSITKRDSAGYLKGIRVLELADETGEYVGKVLAGLGADVAKVEPPAGERTRRIGPFRGASRSIEDSLHFWHYNAGKRSVGADLDSQAGRDCFLDLASRADILIDTRSRSYLSDRGIGFERLRHANQGLIYVRLSPFGDSGPWADFKGSDLVHLALGGVMMNCGYDPDPFGRYDTPPIAPQMWHSYHIAGELTVIGILGALAHRLRCGEGQRLGTSIHEAVSSNTETDTPDWVYLRHPHQRQTCRHSMMSATSPALSLTKDGRYLLPYRTYLSAGAVFSEAALQQVIGLLAKYEMDEGLGEALSKGGDRAAIESKVSVLVDRLVGKLKFEADLWRKGQEHGLPWAPIRRPEENASDPHWIERGTFTKVDHQEDNASYTYVGARWVSEQAPWTVPDRRPPRVGEHTDQVKTDWAGDRAVQPRTDTGSPLCKPTKTSGPSRKPFALAGVRVVDLGWMLASAGAGRYLAALGAEVIKVEHSSRPDGMRYGQGACPPGGRAERAAASGPIPMPKKDTPNRSGSFMEINAGKLSLALNLKSAKGREILEDLIRKSDVVIEGYSPGTMDRMGFGYQRLRELNSGIIYVQQSGFGQKGTYGQARAFGPTAQACSGISEMSGLPEPYPPAGIGYSYLDWFGAYNLATAMLAALYRRGATGEGCHIDTSQTEMGIYLTGTAVLDHSVNGRRWSRYGNRSPHLAAAPHGAYPLAGHDKWIAIATFTETEWRALAAALGHEEWLADPRFIDLGNRLRNQDELDRLVGEATARFEGAALMAALQAVGVPAGTCQTAQDRYEDDPQLRHLSWMVELPQSEIGTWPIKGFPVQLDGSPAYAGGVIGRSGPSYGEDTDRVLGDVLGLKPDSIAALRTAGVL